MTSERSIDIDIDELEQELRAAREVIAALRRRIARDEQQRELESLPVARAIASLESTVELRTRELRESEAHYRALFDHGPTLAFLIDDLGIIVSANATATKLFGGELVDRPLIELFEDHARDTVEQLLTDGDGELDEVALRGGRVVDLGIASVPGFGHTQVWMRDVSARVELGRELQQARRLAAIGRLAAGVAHEINNPLAVLQLGLGELAELDAHAREAKRAELLAHTERIAKIVTKLRSFAAPRAPEGARIEVVQLCEAGFELARRSLGELERGPMLHLDIEPPDLAIVADRRQLEQVMLELLSNAARASLEHPDADADADAEVEVEARAREDRAVVRVIDRGAGIPEVVLEQIFTPFAGGETSFAAGLGLAISWGLVQENEGSIRAYNRAEGGACFELELPLAPPARPVRARSATGSVAGLKILCVEDEASLRRSLVRLLDASGHETIAVETAERAVEHLDADGESFNLVITDVRLPGMSGEQLRQLIADRHPELRERVLLMSGFFPVSEDTPHFLQKPFSLRQLQSAIAAVVAPA